MNMSYCRFQNTLGDLRDCAEHFDDDGLSDEEHTARLRMLRLCKKLVERFADELVEEVPRAR